MQHLFRSGLGRPGLPREDSELESECKIRSSDASNDEAGDIRKTFIDVCNWEPSRRRESLVVQTRIGAARSYRLSHAARLLGGVAQAQVVDDDGDDAKKPVTELVVAAHRLMQPD